MSGIVVHLLSPWLAFQGVGANSVEKLILHTDQQDNGHRALSSLSVQWNTKKYLRRTTEIHHRSA
jgi:hypothetical protein